MEGNIFRAEAEELAALEVGRVIEVPAHLCIIVAAGGGLGPGLPTMRRLLGRHVLAGAPLEGRTLGTCKRIEREREREREW